MGRPYSFPIIALTGLTTTPFAQLATPATVSIEILGVELFQETSETSQQEVIQIARRTTASTLPTATTPRQLRQNDPASLLTGSTTTNAQGVATGTGTLDYVITRLAFNVLNGLIWIPVPELRITMKPSSFLTLSFPTAPAANTWSGAIYFQELS